ncbi:MAG: N-acyl-D-glucosamine 2-epimerase [Cytophagales bacterium CG18_big_fil_WC_8_21_14_2_50_42_9]|nr:MAG: N-acyl-D-glucosamine 2-epimerase [Cytophagales bacterium CG18_big_fil_WC_8_21_14_2_50_42_9]
MIEVPKTNTAITPQLQEYRREMEAELKRILSFWAENTVDEKQGGFVGQIDNKGQINKDAPKGSVLNARILWSFAAAYRHTQNPAYLPLAERAFNYILDHFLDQEFGGIYWSVDAQGKALSTRKQIYGLAFVIYGMSEYYLATQNPRALQVSQELYNWIEQYSYDSQYEGYWEAFSREGELLEDLRLSEKDRNDPKTMNTHLHILEAYTNLYRIWPDETLKQKIENLINVFLRHIIHPETNRMKLFLTRDWQASADLVSYGHDIEASWLLYEAAEVSDNQEIIKQVEKIALNMAEATAAALLPDGSLYHEYDITTNHYDKHREWWVSAEAMVGFFNAYQLTQNENFYQYSINAWQFAKKYLLDIKQGEWFWGVNDDYSLMQENDKIGFWKCPYHNSRSCLEIINRINRINLKAI